MPFLDIYRGKRVLVTGHTGFKGCWLTEWLVSLGANVTGFSLPSRGTMKFFENLRPENCITHLEGDIRSLASVQAAVDKANPEFVFHLAAQPLVRLSYLDPVYTYETNVMGTVNLLEAIRTRAKKCAVIVVTTDKCYENREWVHSYREEDAMGGYDPYSSSKGAAELVVAAYRRSYFSSPNSNIQLASARAGNVIGGGDWAVDRILPDCIRSLEVNEPIKVRNRHATRPWQHVLEPLSGYLWLGANLVTGIDDIWGTRGISAATSFNFGPGLDANRDVAELVGEVLRNWQGTWVDFTDPAAVHEAHLLNLATDKAFHVLKWRSTWTFSEAVKITVEWYKRVHLCESVTKEITRNHIKMYESDAHNQELLWTK